MSVVMAMIEHCIFWPEANTCKLWWQWCFI